MARPGRNLLIVAVVLAVVAAAFVIPMLAGHPPAPSIDFSFTAKGMSYTFDALIFRYTAPVNYTWTFGDGQQSSGRSDAQSNPTQFNVTHVYSTTGTYTVALSIVDVYGSTGAASHSVTVTNYVPASATLTAVVKASTATVTATVSGGSPPYYVGFNFGDGVSLTRSGMGPDVSWSHPYLYTGTYTITATIGDSTQTPTVPALNSAVVTITYTPTVASMKVTVADMNVTANVSVSGGNPPYQLVYDFGDDTPALRTSNPLVTHTYAKAGTYTVNVTVYDTSLASPKYLVQSVTVPPPGPIVQVIGVSLIGSGAILGVVAYEYRRLRTWWFGTAIVALLALGAVLLLGVLF